MLGNQGREVWWARSFVDVRTHTFVTELAELAESLTRTIQL
jgi:hypothetical protein